MSNRYCNLPGPGIIKDTFGQINTGFDGVQTDIDAHLADDAAHGFMQRQAIINGNFDVPQRGTSFTNPVNGAYLLDRWQVAHSADGGTLPANITHSQQKLTPGDIPNAFFFDRITTDGAGSGFGVGAYYIKSQKIENGTRYLCGAGKKITVSFWARSNISNKRIGVSIRQNYGAGGSPSPQEFLQVAGQIITLTSTWTKYTLTFTTNTLVGKTFGTNNDDYLHLSFFHMWGTTIASNYFGGGTAETFGGAGNVPDISRVHVHAGEEDLPFPVRSFAEELALCQRYYEKSYHYQTTPGTASAGTGIESKYMGSTVAISQPYGTTKFKVKKRITPTVTIYPYTTPTNTGRVSGNDGTDLASNSGTTHYIGDGGFGVYNNSGGTLSPSLGAVIFHWTADAEL
ncbi:hypothetical protein ACFPPD_06705 [Cohnella suwonensis]|uniref:CBM-cenC domain-containing protein n=1 Tax=Cohnella suwonensis TaxID=696072 RepID=A0ABW0LR81_9BACL